MHDLEQIKHRSQDTWRHRLHSRPTVGYPSGQVHPVRQLPQSARPSPWLLQAGSAMSLTQSRVHYSVLTPQSMRYRQRGEVFTSTQTQRSDAGVPIWPLAGDGLSYASRRRLVGQLLLSYPDTFLEAQRECRVFWPSLVQDSRLRESFRAGELPVLLDHRCRIWHTRSSNRGVKASLLNQTAGDWQGAAGCWYSGRTKLNWT